MLNALAPAKANLFTSGDGGGSRSRGPACPAGAAQLCEEKARVGSSRVDNSKCKE